MDSLSEKKEAKKIRWNKIAEDFLTIFVIMTIAAVSFSGFFNKWRFREGKPEYGIELILSRTADKPYVYRQLLPIIAKTGANLFPDEDLREKMHALSVVANPPKQYSREYLIIYILDYISIYISIIILKKILDIIWKKKAISWLGAIAFAIIFPIFETWGGYYYDPPEIMFFFLATLFSMKGQWLPMIFLSPIATLNKEAFFFFLPTLFPILQLKLAKRHSFGVISVSMLISGLVYLWIANQFAQNAGESVHFHLWNHIKSWFDIASYFEAECTYIIPLGGFILHVPLICYIVYKTWEFLPREWRTHAKLALASNLPLYFLFSHPEELRNLSMLYVSFAIILARYIQSVLAKAQWGNEA